MCGSQSMAFAAIIVERDYNSRGFSGVCLFLSLGLE